jgi:hypothetical protein
LFPEDSRVYLGYHPQKEGKYSRVFPKTFNLETISFYTVVFLGGFCSKIVQQLLIALAGHQNFD